MVDEAGSTGVISAPANLAVAPGNEKNTVTWDAVTGAIKYNLYFNTTGSPDKTDTQLADVTSPYNHTGLTNATTYYYVVTAEDDVTESDESSAANGTPTASPSIAAPTLFSAVAGDSKITLNWASVSGATGYRVYRDTSTGVTQGTGTLVASPTDTTFLDEPLDNGTTYYYIVTAFNDTDESADSSEVSATPRAATEGQAVAMDYVSPLIDVPLNAKAFDIDGWISYRRQASDTSVTLKIESSGEEVFDQTIGPISLPSVQSVPVYGGTYYYGGAFYYGISFAKRLQRKKFDARNTSNAFQVRVQSDDVNPLSIVEIGMRFRAASQ